MRVLSVLAGRTPRALEDAFAHPLEVLPWMNKLSADNRASGFAAADWLYQSWAYQAHDVGTTPGFDGNTNAALASISARTLILAPSLDYMDRAYRDALQPLTGSPLDERVYTPIAR